MELVLDGRSAMDSEAESGSMKVPRSGFQSDNNLERQLVDTRGWTSGSMLVIPSVRRLESLSVME